MRHIAPAAKFKSAFAEPAFIQLCALQPITDYSVELINAMANQRRSDEFRARAR